MSVHDEQNPPWCAQTWIQLVVACETARQARLSGCALLLGHEQRCCAPCAALQSCIWGLRVQHAPQPGDLLEWDHIPAILP